MAKGWLKKFKLLDIFPKSSDDVVEKSTFGAVVSIVGSLVLLFLVVSEIREYASTEKKESLWVNYNRGEQMKVNFRIAFLALPCDMISIDVNDRLGEEQVAVNKRTQQISMINWKGDIQALKEEVIKENRYTDFSDYKSQHLLWTKMKHRNPKKECNPCFEASKPSGRSCCNNCFDLAKAFHEDGLNVTGAFQYPQCQNTAEKYGCLLSGSFSVNKVAGSFHVAVGDTHSDPGQRHHHHWDEPLRQFGFNSSHHISHLSFGEEFPGIVNPLDGFTYVEPALGQQQYFLQIVPTSYKKSNGRVINTNQFSVTYQYSPVDITSEHFELPGTFFKFDISPLFISMVEDVKPLAHFITRIFAVVGGVWVVLGLVYKGLAGAFGLVLPQKKH